MPAYSPGFVRPVSLKLKNGIINRNITKIVPLINVEPEKQTTRQIRYDKRNKNKSNHNFFTISSQLVLNVVFLFFLCSTVFCNDVKKTKLNNKSPSIQQHIFDYWNVVLKYNRSNYDQEVTFAFESYDFVASFCENVTNFIQACDQKLEFLQSKVVQIINNNEYIGGSVNLKPRRMDPLTVMGLGIVVGFTSKYKYDHYFSTDLQQLSQNQEMLIKNLKNETTILNDTINTIKSENDAIDQNFNNLYDAMLNSSYDIDKLSITQQLHAYIVECSTKLDEIIDGQEKIMYPHRHINTIISAKQLKTVFTDINKYAPRVSLPSNKFLIELFNLTQITSKVSGNTIGK